MTMKRTKTVQIRLRDKHIKQLNRMARSVNLVWNYVNELSERAIREKGLFFSAYDIHYYVNGSGKELGLHSQTVQRVATEYVIRRNQFKKRKLAWRKSRGGRRSLGWIPISTKGFKWKGDRVIYNKFHLRVLGQYDLSQCELRSASLNEDARGRWYFNVAIIVPEPEVSKNNASVGVDLGLKDIATTSDGQKLVNNRFYKDMEKKLAIAQRSGNKKRIRSIHAKIRNRRKDASHKFSRKLVDQYGLINVGDVSSNKLVKTRMAKSVYDAGWGQLKKMLEYKCDNAGKIFRVINEKYTTQVCSSCGVIPNSSPKGVTDLGMREWICSGCGALHDRDVNAAKNILALGHGRPVEEIPTS